ncbi:Ribosomal protein S16 [Niveomyces insectorum RCEF 264]|uniref:Ribosomal protein S16 n=1 Tax=Niveomyces insectorum RCEF 264 TaxID=1081102 RepID=A0A167T520_9HYPO|nr:Ribosomal protein S16 [Niveomyces insectorum RCEF 264]
MEVLGTYDPIPRRDPYDVPVRGGTSKAHKDVQLDVTRAKYWIGVGAQPTEPVWRLLSMVGILEPKHRPGQAQQQPATTATTTTTSETAQEANAKA